MNFEKTRKMEKLGFHKMKAGKVKYLLDTSIIDRLNESGSTAFEKLIEKGGGKEETVTRLKEELRKAAEKYPACCELLGVDFENVNCKYYMSIECSRTNVYNENGLEYAFWKPYAYRLNVYDRHDYHGRPLHHEEVGRWTLDSPVVMEASIS